MQKVFAAFDVKAAAYGMLMLFPTRGLALRAFADVCAAPDSPMAKYPGDYALYELADYDPASGKILCHKTPIHIASASQCLDAMKSAPKVEAEKAEVVA